MSQPLTRLPKKTYPKLAKCRPISEQYLLFGLNFTGQQYVDLGNPSSLDLGASDFSLEAFVYPTAVVGSGIGFDSCPNANGFQGSTPLSWNHVIGSGANRIIFISFYSDTAATSVTVGGVSATFIRRDRNGEIWYLVAPASGSQTVIVTTTSGTISGGSVSYTGVDQVSPIDSSAYATNNNNKPSVQITLANANEATYHSLIDIGGNLSLSSWDSGQTQRFANTIKQNIWGADKVETTSGLKTYGATLSGSETWDYQVVAFNPVRAPVIFAQPSGIAGHFALWLCPDGTIRVDRWTGTAKNTQYAKSSALKYVFNAWNHIAITYSAGAFIIYLNGKSETPSVLTDSKDFGNTTSQVSCNSSTYYFRGKLGKILMYSRKLSVDEIQFNIRNPMTPRLGSLVLWLPMIEGSETVLNDYSGLGNNGTISSGVSWYEMARDEPQADVL